MLIVAMLLAGCAAAGGAVVDTIDPNWFEQGQKACPQGTSFETKVGPWGEVTHDLVEVRDHACIDAEGKKHGPCTVTLVDGGSVLEVGAYEHGLREGFWRFFWHNGQKAREGNFAKGKRVGPWSSWHNDKQKAWQGTFRDGKRHGEFTWWDQKGRRLQRGGFEDDKQQGTWTYWGKDGKIEKVVEYEQGKTVKTEEP
jgi:hypothetical protein